MKTNIFLIGAIIAVLPAPLAANLTIVNDFNTTHLLTDIFHLGDNQNDSRFIPANPLGTSLTLNFSLSAAQLNGQTITLSLDQYQADNIDPALRSFVEVNGSRAGSLSFNSLLIDLTGATTLPVVTDSFSVAPLLKVGQNTLVFRSVFNGADFDDFDVTNVRLGGVSSTVPEPSPRGVLAFAFGAAALVRLSRFTRRKSQT